MKLIILILAFIAITSAELCASEGDPHYRAFGGVHFNFYATGEYVLFQKAGFQCNTNLRSSNQHWIGASLNVGLSCVANGVYFQVSGDNTYLNEQSNFSGSRNVNGVEVSRNGNEFRIAYSGIEVKGNINGIHSGDVRHYMNIYVYGPHNHGVTSGLCLNQRPQAQTTLFHHGNVAQFREAEKRTVDNSFVVQAKEVCGKHFAVGSNNYNDCVADVSVTHQKRMAGQLEGFSELLKGDFARSCNQFGCHYYKKEAYQVTTHHTKRVANDAHRAWAKSVAQSFQVKVDQANAQIRAIQQTMTAHVNHWRKVIADHENAKRVHGAEWDRQIAHIRHVMNHYVSHWNAAIAQHRRNAAAHLQHSRNYETTKRNVNNHFDHHINHVNAARDQYNHHMNAVHTSYRNQANQRISQRNAQISELQRQIAVQVADRDSFVAKMNQLIHDCEVARRNNNNAYNNHIAHLQANKRAHQVHYDSARDAHSRASQAEENAARHYEHVRNAHINHWNSQINNVENHKRAHFNHWNNVIHRHQHAINQHVPYWNHLIAHQQELIRQYSAQAHHHFHIAATSMHDVKYSTTETKHRWVHIHNHAL